MDFIPNETTLVTINNQPWTTWTSAQGDVRLLLPPQWASLGTIHIWAASGERGRNASLRVYHGDQLRQVMDFDNDEDHDVDQH